MIKAKSYNHLKRVIHSYLDPQDTDSNFQKAFNIFMVILILLNTLSVMLETVESFESEYGSILYAFEIFSIIIFTAEYLLRIWTINVNQKYYHSVGGRLKYIFTPLALIDLLSILPFFIYSVMPFDLRFLRLFRIFRFVRLAKLGRYSTSLRTLGHVFKVKKEELLMTFYIVAFSVIIASCFIYMAEHEAQPDKFSSIPESLYWTVITITSVGYGDVFPVTEIGKLVTGVVALLGLALFAIPTGIIASGFYEVVEGKLKKCPHCGKEL